MCGIAAIYAYENDAVRVNPDELIRIRDAMLARGPDGNGLWMNDTQCVGLAHRRLAIIDLSDQAQQPMHSADGLLSIIFNGEIYNYQILRSMLEKEGCVFHTQSDTEVILHLYTQYGEALFAYLRGMYAFVIWDHQQQKMLLGRDPYGIKPLYYADNGNTVRIASQVKALLKSPHVDTKPKPAGCVGFYLLGHVPEPYTLYRGIQALPAGHYLWVDKNGIHSAKAHFSIKRVFIHAQQHPQPDLSMADIKTHLRAALKDTVSHHLVADVPVGIFLSAGLDSATITGLASECVSQALQTMTLGFSQYRDTHQDEVPLATMLARHYGTEHQTHWISEADTIDEFNRIMQVMDQPSIDGVNTYFISKMAAKRGLKVVLSGVGGDELFGGYPTFRRIPKLVCLFKHISRHPSFTKHLGKIAYALFRRARKVKYAGVIEYGGNYTSAYFLNRCLLMPRQLHEVMEPDFIQAGWHELDLWNRMNDSVDGVTDETFIISALEQQWYMRNQLLRDTDWAGMAHSVEIRVPFVDAHLQQTVAALFPYHPSKTDMANSLLKPLPENVLHRKKTGFNVPMREWFLREKQSAISKNTMLDWARLILRY